MDRGSSRLVRARLAPACLAVGTALFSGHATLAQVIDLPAIPASRPFFFDGAFRAAPGLRFQFSRPVPTCGPDGAPIGADQARFARPSLLASAPAFEQVYRTAAPVTMIASGLDHDGVTPLLVTYETRTPAYLDVYNGAGDAVPTAARTGHGRVRTIVADGSDILNGTIAGKHYRLTSGVVCHGLIVLFCTVSAYDAGTDGYRDSANAFIVSQDQGRTWSLVYESAPFALGWPRGSPWTMQNWWPTARGVAPKEAFFAATDYCNNPGSPGGRFYLMRARRPAPGQPWTLEPGIVAFSSTDVPGLHLHAGGVVPYGPSGIRAFLAIGDLRARNRIVSLVNRQGDYTSGSWEILDQYHGAAGNPGIEADQFVGCAPGPWGASALVGGDIMAEQVMLLSMPESSDHPQTTSLGGMGTVNGTGSNTFIIRTPTPELAGPYCANTEPFLSVPVPQTHRTLYSPDGLRWAQAAAPAGGYPVIHGPHIYFDGSASQGIVRIPVPRLVAARPLLLGPGGLQQSRFDPTLSANAPTRITALPRDALGRWTDEGVVLDPQPPTLGPVFKVRTSSNDASPWIARIYPAGQSNPVNRVLGDHIQLRVWACHLDSSRTGTLGIGIGDSVSAPQMYRGFSAPSTGSWIPLTATEPVSQAPGSTLQLYLRCGADICDDETVYVALDALLEGRGVPGYPMPPDVSSPPNGDARPDEIGRVTGLMCTGTWTISLALQVADDGFDFTSDLQSQWPLATLWADDQNYIVLDADTQARKLVMRETIKGNVVRSVSLDAANYLRGSEVLVSLAQTSTGGIELSASVGGLALASSADQLPSTGTRRFSVTPREIRFAAPTPFPSSSGRGAAVSPLLVWGGQVDDHRALTRAQREQLLRSLSFLKPISP